MQEQDSAKTVDVTPTWEATAEILCVVMRDGSYEGFCAARAEVRRMGQMLDQLQKTMQEAAR